MWVARFRVNVLVVSWAKHVKVCIFHPLPAPLDFKRKSNFIAKTAIQNSKSTIFYPFPLNIEQLKLALLNLKLIIIH